MNMTAEHSKAIGKEIALPEMNSFGDVFEEFSQKDGDMKPILWDATDFFKDKPITIPIGAHCSIRGNDVGYNYFKVKPSAKVVEYIQENMYPAGHGDSIYFEIIVWDKDQALIVARNSTIIASRWVALIDPKTIPEISDED